MIRRVLLVALFLTPTALVVAWHVGLAWLSQLEPNATAVTRSEGPIDDIRQVTDPERRREALDDVRARLREGGDPRDVAAAMLTLERTADVAYDRSGLRELLEPYVRGDDVDLGLRAVSALSIVDPRPGDLDTALALCAAARTEREPLPLHASTLARFDDGRLRGAAAQAVIDATSRDDPHVVDRVVRGLWGVAPSDELGAHLVDLLARCDALDEPDWRDVAYDVVYYGLTTFSDKPSVVVDALIDELTSPHVLRSRVVWALSFGVPSDRAGDVADALTEAYDAGAVDEDVFALVARYGDAAHRAWLVEIADHPRAVARVRTAAADALADFDARAERDR